MAERREIRRWRLIRYLRVFERNAGQFLGHLVDISETGMALVSENPLVPYENLRLYVEILAENVMIDAQCVWCKEDPRLGSYNSGLRILAPSPQTRMKVRCLIDALSSSDSFWQAVPDFNTSEG